MGLGCEELYVSAGIMSKVSDDKKRGGRKNEKTLSSMEEAYEGLMKTTGTGGVFLFS